MSKPVKPAESTTIRKSAAKARIGFTLLNGKVMEVGVDIPGVDLALADLGAEP